MLKFVRVLGQFSIDAYYDFQRATSLRGPIPQKEMTCITVTQQVLPLAIWRPFADFVLPKGAKVCRGSFRKIIKGGGAKVECC